jgi:hypothetical protein
VPADTLFEKGLPWDQLEADAVIDHGEAAARELCGTNKGAADIFAGLGGGEFRPALGSHRPAHAVHFGTLEICDKIL